MRRPIVAVFGKSKGADSTDSERALVVGACVAFKGWILLTGGEGIATEHAVKESAIRGAKVCAGQWIGVVQTGGPDAKCSEENGFVIKTNFGQGRNYLEACLCDTAIALPGGSTGGTLSEAASALICEKPVVFLDEWPSVDAVLNKLAEESEQIFDKLKNVEPFLEKCPTQTELEQKIRNTRKELVHLNRDIRNAIGCLGDPLRVGGFPDLGDPYKEIKKKYETWLGTPT
jgi:uncharacterized protein (TIGR00725 family)